jgi:hypothetical protein
MYEDVRTFYNIFDRKNTKRKTFWNRHRQKHNMKTGFEEKRRQNVGRIPVAQDRDQWHNEVQAVKGIQVTQKTRNLSGCKAVTFSRTLLFAVYGTEPEAGRNETRTPISKIYTCDYDFLRCNAV